MKNKTNNNVAESTTEAISRLLDEVMKSGAAAATAIITMPDGKQIKISGRL